MADERTAITQRPFECVICGKDLTPTPEQLEALRKFGNPLRREPCLLTEDGQHRVDADEMERRKAEWQAILDEAVDA